MTDADREYEARSSLAATLTAYLDGELGEPVRKVIEARLAAEPALRTLLTELERGRTLGCHIFQVIEDDPVPPELIRAAKVTPSAR